MPSKKIVCCGGASMNFAGMYSDIISKKILNGSEIVIYDIDRERAELMAKYVQKLVEIVGGNFRVRVINNLIEAIDDADFVIGDIGGVGGGGGGFYHPGGIHSKDLLICAKYGIYQIIGDTCGPAAMMAAFRTIPIYLNIWNKMEKKCPNAIFINHANPMAILCRAGHKYSSIKSIIGICHGVQSGIRYIAEILNLPPEELETIWIGTNHYYWFTKIYYKRKDKYPELKKKMAQKQPPKNYTLHAKLSKIFGYQIVYPDDSHIIEFYPFLAQIKDINHLPYYLSESHHGNEVLKIYTKKRNFPINRGKIVADFKKFLDNSIKNFIEKLGNSTYQNKNGATASKKRNPLFESIGALVESIATGERKVCIVNIPNRSSVPNLPDTAILEVEGVTDFSGVRGLYMGEAPLILKGQLEKIIAWQELVVDAAVKGDRNIALQALMVDPVAILPDKSEKMFNELLTNSKSFLPQFKI